MRLISQNGEFDVPYENTSLRRTENFIRAYVPMTCEKEIIVAQYSTEEKAEKTMKMLHDTVTGIFLAENIEFDPEIGNDLTNMIQKKGFGIITVSRDSRDVEFKPANIVFQFPKDDEI